VSSARQSPAAGRRREGAGVASSTMKKVRHDTEPARRVALDTNPWSYIADRNEAMAYRDFDVGMAIETALLPSPAGSILSMW